jgi:GTPase SAR1 family protein
MFKTLLKSLFDDTSKDDKSINILFLGGSGVGKTSTLTAMYDRFNSVVDTNLDIQLLPDDVTSNRLNRKLAELKKQVALDEVRAKPTLIGTKQLEEYNFYVAKDEDSSQKLHLKFRDFPGGYLESERIKVKSFIKDSNVLVIPVDTTTLLEEGGVWSEMTNAPATLFDTLRAIKGSFEMKNRLVLFVALKSEKYLQGTDYYTNRIRDEVEREFKNLINFFKSNKLSEKVAVVLTSIQTLGDVEFSMIERDTQQNPIFIYKKRDFNSRYSPKDTEQPLKYILAFAISEYLRKRGNLNKKVSDMFDLDAQFIDAIKHFSDNYKRDHNFVILQGEKLVKYKEEENFAGN